MDSTEQLFGALWVIEVQVTVEAMVQDLPRLASSTRCTEGQQKPQHIRGDQPSHVSFLFTVEIIDGSGQMTVTTRAKSLARHHIALGRQILDPTLLGFWPYT